MAGALREIPGAIMRRILVTGGAGFIGSNFVRMVLAEQTDCLIINLDKLTYAGNLENLTGLMDNPNHKFVKGDICDAVLVEKLIDEHRIQARTCVHLRRLTDQE